MYKKLINNFNFFFNFRNMQKSVTKPNNNLVIMAAATVGVLVLFGLGLAVWGALQFNNSQLNNYEVVDPSDLISTENLLADSNTVQPGSVLTQEEIDGLLMMREEEKLARDVYLTLYDRWQLPIFKNIAASEATHTSAVADLLDMYQITDPVTNDAVGVFTNPAFTDLYKSLVEQGNESAVIALKVGATIEDLDIKDLQELLKKTSNTDIITVYNNLEKGSRNHIRSFTQNLTKYGASYAPQYISQQAYDLIISGSRETGSANR